MNSIAHRPLHQQVRESLWREITQGEFSKARMLPPETELCDRLEVSRTTLRRAVTALEQEGLLHRRQGIGTLVDHNVASLKARMDLKLEFSELLARAGFRPEVRFVEATEEPADQRFAESLQMVPGASLLSISKMWLADDRPAILCADRIPASLVLRPYTERDLHGDILTVLDELCELQVHYQIATLIPQCADSEAARFLRVEPAGAIMGFDGICYDKEGRPVVASTEWYAPGILSFTMLRAKV
jgi:DNA-binding GntR family transcriptional regulator